MAHLVEVFAVVRRVLRRDGTLWVVIGDSFAGNRGNSEEKPGFDNKAAKGGANLLIGTKRETGLRDKELIGIPWLFAFAMRRDGWLIRQEIVWAKPSCMPESVTDRTTRAHETVFMFVRQGRYFYDAEAIKEPLISTPDEYLRAGKSVRDNHQFGAVAGVPLTETSFQSVPNGRNKRSVWTVNPQPFSARDLGITETDHYAAYPPALVDPMVRAGTSERGVCPTCGAPWRRVVEQTDTRHWSERRRNSSTSRAWADGSGGTHAGTEFQRAAREERGWVPTCACTAGDPRPATVLDPFAGAGTTLMVADRLGHDAIGVELNPSYAEMALKRVEADRLARDPILREQAAARAGGWTAPTLWEVTP